MHVLVTGGLGYIGGEAVRRFLQRGDRVSVVDLPRIGAVAPTPHENLAVHFADITNPTLIGPLLRGVDVVVHGAGIHQADEVVRHPNRHVEVNVNGTYNMLEAAVGAGVSRFVHLSSAKIYGPVDVDGASNESDLVRPADEYSLGKYAAESFCNHFAEHTPLEVCALRPFSVYGPAMDLRTGYCGALLDALLSGTAAVLSGRPDYSRDFVHLDTVADVVVAAATSSTAPPPRLNVGSGTSTTLAELVAVFDAHVCRDLEVTYSEPRPGTLDRTLADISLMSEFACPDIPDLRTGISEMIARHRTRQ
ncbi:MAG: NAD-dependent epimerase/dehydratase family protein [Acidimicrobiales bacterium]